MSNLLKINSLYILLIFLSHLFGQVNKTEASFQKNNRELVSFWSKFNQRGLDLSKKNFSVVNETKLKNSTIFLTLYQLSMKWLKFTNYIFANFLWHCWDY